MKAKLKRTCLVKGKHYEGGTTVDVDEETFKQLRSSHRLDLTDETQAAAEAKTATGKAKKAARDLQPQLKVIEPTIPVRLVRDCVVALQHRSAGEVVDATLTQLRDLLSAKRVEATPQLQQLLREARLLIKC